MRRIPQPKGTVPLSAVASGMSLATADGANPTVVEDALSVGVEGTAAQADVEQSKLRSLLPHACKKRRTPQIQLAGMPKGKPPSEYKLVPATKEATPVVFASVTRVVEERQSIRASLPRACKNTSNIKPEDTPSDMPPEKKPSNENLETKPF